MEEEQARIRTMDTQKFKTLQGFTRKSKGPEAAQKLIEAGQPVCLDDLATYYKLNPSTILMYARKTCKEKGYELTTRKHEGVIYALMEKKPEEPGDQNDS